MHSLKITHTDLKPENILMTSTSLIKKRVKINRSKSSSLTTKESEEATYKMYLP